MNKILSIACGIALTASATAAVASDHFIDEYYIGGKLGHSHVDAVPSSDDTELGYGIYGGIDFGNVIDGYDATIGLELNGTDYGSYSGDDIQGYGLSVRVNQPIFEKTELFGRVGSEYIDAQNYSNDWSVLGAVGVSYEVMENVKAQVEYQHSFEFLDDDAQFFTFGLAYTFGGHDHVAVTPVVEPVAVVVPEDVTIKFDTNEFVLDDYDKAMLDNVTVFLVENGDFGVDVLGHADGVGAASYNKELSLKRAFAVTNYLIDKGIAPQRIWFKGNGELGAIDGVPDPEQRVVHVSYID